jgi:4-diphosphocytidyl-2-C-methyl-D-erythritol kinase
MTLTAPAKLNLSLRVLGKRDDGFHDIDTLMVRLPGLADEITISPADSFTFTCSDPTVPADESNLVVKALRAFEKATRSTQNISIHLNKTIPHGAGLGGGSSDAASTLLALNTLLTTPLPTSQLIEIAASLGSDIPFFLMPGPVRCTGRGEILTPAPTPPPPLHVLLLKPSFGVPTPDAYGRWKTAETLPGLDHSPISFPWGELINDLERPVFFKHRFLAELKLWLNSRPEVAAALMSGSGSTVFAILNTPAVAEDIARAAKLELDPYLWSWHGLTEGP